MDAHRYQGADVNRQCNPGISARHHVAHRVTPENRDTPLVQPRQAARIEAGHPLAKRIPSTFGLAPRRAAGADQQHVAFFHVNSLRLLGSIEILGEYWCTRLEPFDFFEARNIEQDAAADATRSGGM